MPVRWPALDNSHQPYKRVGTLGTGPRGRERMPERKNWECNKIKGEDYKQLCVWVGAEGKGHKRGSKKVVKTDKAWKKKYNKEYNKFLDKAGRPRSRRNVAQPKYKYRVPKEVSTTGAVQSIGRGRVRRSASATAAASARPARRPATTRAAASRTRTRRSSSR